ncbi:MAG: hypothetical protein JWR51_3435 [Devosia sp.]|uniref:hypothetical protein n=1 Tax=Devosia sp. TaxID=1871048 RepID=UPI00263717D0|nr:hypothetical protein [Devosia sp.]MDB5530332.1 hypothetical protein [Devosia sp.]
MAKAKTKSTIAKATKTGAKATTVKSVAAGKARPDADPANPGRNEVSETADLATARVLANIGAPGCGVEEMALAATTPTLAIDISKLPPSSPLAPPQTRV